MALMNPKSHGAWPTGYVDLTVRQQPYPQSVDRASIPQSILEKTLMPIEIVSSDIFAPAKLEEAHKNGIPYSASALERDPALRHFAPCFPGNIVERNGLKFRYVPMAINASVEPLEGILNYRMSGRTVLQIYEESIKPKLRALT